MRILLVTLAAAGCVPPTGSWASWGQAPSGAATSSRSLDGQPSAPPLPENLVATGAAKRLTRITHDDATAETDASLSPDGRWLLYTSSVFDDGPTEPTARRVMKSRADGRGGVLLTGENGFAYSPAWLPSGASYVAVSDAMGGRGVVRTLRVAPRAASSRILGDRDVNDPGGLTVSPDGTQLAFHSSVNGTFMIGIARLDGSELTHLVPGAFPAWSPDGQRLAFHRQVGGDWQVLVTDTEGGELTQLTEGANDQYPTWSPDGRSIAFLSNRGWQRYADATATSAFNLYTVRVDGSGLVALTEGNRWAATPRWARDGKIYFSSNEAGSTDVWRLEPDRAVLADGR